MTERRARPAMTMREIRTALGYKSERDAEPVAGPTPATQEQRMPDIHLVITRPEPGEWLGRLDVVEALETAGWTGDDDMPLSILRHPSGAVFGVSNEHGDSSLDCPNHAIVEFPSDTPTVVVIAACLAATA